MSATKFKYSFRRAYGMTAHEFVRRTRMAEAEKLLAAGDMTVSGVALMVGYMKPGAFAAAFKKHTGMLPRYYMKAHGKIRGRENAAKRAEAAGA
jgi:AraC-like DNA-binding protein